MVLKVDGSTAASPLHFEGVIAESGTKVAFDNINWWDFNKNGEIKLLRVSLGACRSRFREVIVIKSSKNNVLSVSPMDHPYNALHHYL